MHSLEQRPKAGDRSSLRFSKYGLWLMLGFSVIWMGSYFRIFQHEPDPASQVTIENPWPGDAEVVKSAMEVFAVNCPGLFGPFRRDVEQIRALVYHDLLGVNEDKGWNQMIEVRVQLSRDAASMPVSWRAGGHTLYYYLGAGRDPGITAKKEQSQLACGMPTSRGNDTFKSVRELGFLDKAIKAELTPKDANKELALPMWAQDIDLGYAPVGERRLIARALPSFAKICPKLIREHLVDIKSISAAVIRNTDASQGWKSSVWLYFDFKKNPVTIPPQRADQLGWSVIYHLGAGPTAGVLPDSDVARWLCGLSEDTSKPIVPVPELAFLKDLD